MTSEAKFKSVCESLCGAETGVSEGPMMSSPGLKFKNKVFAFYYNDEMVFRLGKGYHIEQHGISEFTHLSPFKNKPPMAGWFCIDEKYSQVWETLAYEALEVMRSGK